MLLTAIAVACGLVLGFLRRGSLQALRTTRIRWWPVVVVGLVFQATEQFESLPGQVGWYLVGLLLLIAATMANVHLKGAAILGIGLTSNLMVVLFNGHIPLRWESFEAVNPEWAGTDPSTVEIRNGLWTLETPDTQLASLGDIVPVPITGDVVSFGDLVLLAGVIVLVMNLLLRRTESGLDDFFVEDLDVIEPPMNLAAGPDVAGGGLGEADGPILGGDEGIVSVRPVTVDLTTEIDLSSSEPATTSPVTPSSASGTPTSSTSAHDTPESQRQS